MVSKEPLWRRAVARVIQVPAQRFALATTASAGAPAEGKTDSMRASASALPRLRLPRDWTPWLMLAIAIIAALMRLYGINWDANNHLHPDEREIVFRAMCLNFPGQPRDPTCDPAYNGPGWFFSIHSPLNPHFFAYGSFPLYLLAVVAHGLAWLTSITNGAFHPSDGGAFADYNHFALVGRALSALFDTGSVIVGGLIARRLAGRWAGVLAAAFIAVIPFNIQVSHFYAVDTPTLFFILLTLWACVAIAQYATRIADAPVTGRLAARQSWAIWGLGALAGASFALAFASKVSAAPLLAPIFFAALLVWRRKGLEYALLALAGAGFAAMIAFLVTSPYALIDWKEFTTQVSEQTALSQGKLDYPYVRQFAGTTPFVYQLQQMLLYDMGLPLGILGLGGFAWALSRLWRRWDDDWVLLIAWIVPYFAIIGDAYTKFTRYMLPVFAPLAICGAGVVVALAAWGARKAPLLWRRWNVSPAVWARPLAIGLAAVALLGAGLESLAIDNLYSAPNTRVQASQWIYDHVPAHSILTSEVWDDSLPILVPPAKVVNGVSYTDSGHVIDPGQYGIIGLNLYDQDTPQKAGQLAASLANSDVVVISSQRLLRSIPKLPSRYPMTIRYYQLLFAGRLGFHLAATFQKQPSFLGITWNDSGADESFSVYDHPPVWIFVRDGVGLTANQLNAELTHGVNFDTVTNLSGSQKPLMLSPQDLAADQLSPTMAVQFPADSLANRAPLPWWLLIVELLGLVTFPLTFSVFSGLRDRGWGFSKLLGLLLVAWLVWLPSSFRLVPFTSAAVAGAFALVAVAGAVVAWHRRVALWAFVNSRWRLLLANEALFVVGFLFFTWIRALDPDLWHIYRGGEKPMELAFLNGILRSRYMPPLDPWFAGGAINYYYYGQYLIAVLIRLTGIVPTTAFNLAIPLLFGLTLSGAASVVAGVTRRWWAGLAGGIAVAVVANLDGLWQVWRNALTMLTGGQPAPFDYWASSRVIPYTINEFPFWSFLYADLHAHVIDLPIVILIVGLCASLLARARRDGGRWLPVAPTLAVAALALGAVWCVNTWDLPACAILLISASALRLFPFGSQRPLTWRGVMAIVRWPLVRAWGLAIGVTLGATYLLYLPFHATFVNFTSGIGQVTTPTNPTQFFTLFGVWLFLIVTFFIVELRDRLERDVNAFQLDDEPPARYSLWLLALIVGGALLIGVSIRLDIGLAMLLALGGWLALDLRHSPTKLLTYMLALLGVAIAIGVEVIYLRDFLDGGDWERMNTVFKFYYQVWVCFSLSGALIFSQRLPRALGLASGLRQSQRMTSMASMRPLTPRATQWARSAWLIGLSLLLGGSLIFDSLGTQARVNDPAIWAAVQPPPGGVQPKGLSLDGMAYMRGWYPEDYAAINWLNVNVSGAPTIVEASAVPYEWYNRVSIYTGLPDVLGWGSHEQQQRYPDQVAARQFAVQSFYLTTDPKAALKFLSDYHVSYIYVGGLERSCITTGPNGECVGLPAQSLSKFIALTQEGYIKPVFSDGATVIFRVVHV
jgi:YYY domain-containing protein